MNTTLILCATSMCLKNFHSRKLSQLASSASSSHCSNCNTHRTAIINTCSLISCHLLKSAAMQRAAFLPMVLAQNFHFSATFPILRSLEPPSILRRLGWWTLTPPEQPLSQLPPPPTPTATVTGMGTAPGDRSIDRYGFVLGAEAPCQSETFALSY